MVEININAGKMHFTLFTFDSKSISTEILKLFQKYVFTVKS